jgi:hypothetical protein
MSSFTKQVQNWVSGFLRRAELDRLSKFEISRIAGDARASIGELYELSSRGPEAAALLPRRMRVLGLHEATIAHDEPATLHDMQRLCSLCASHRRCERDLGRDPGDSIWWTYCPNASNFRALR